MPFTHGEPSRSACGTTKKQFFSLCLRFAEANLHRCFPPCADSAEFNSASKHPRRESHAPAIFVRVQISADEKLQ
jgi:hypothetical protein